MDIFDRAQEADARFRDMALERQLDAGREKGVGRKNCIDCGEEIPEKRRVALPGCIRCIDCQTMFEGENR